MKQELRIITPLEAEELLKSQANPRNIKRWHVDEFKRHLVAGTFEVTHQGIAIDCDGRLVDGQHRLTAILETNKEAMMWVAYGITEEATIAVDRGMKRTTADFLHIHKFIAQPVNLAAKLAHGTSRPRESEVRTMYEIIGDDLSSLLEVSRGLRRGPSCPIRLGAVLNFRKGSDNKEIISQFKAYSFSSFDDMWPSIQALVRRVITSGRKSDTHTDVVAAFKAFNPKNKEAVSIRIYDAAEDIKIIRMLLRGKISEMSGC